MAVHSNASARGVSPYLPLNIDPAIERKIERVLLLAGKPVMRRPIAAAIVLEALPKACERDAELCEEVRGYLRRYMKSYGVTTLQVNAAYTSGSSRVPIPNQHGQSVDSNWQAIVSGFVQPSDYVILNAGGIAYDGYVTATGSFASIGFDFAQLDIGYRDHWFSPLTDSSTLISPEAKTMPSITLSNYRPLTPLGISYEVFAAEMSRQEGIEYFGSTTSGRPRLSGIQIGMEPASGYAIAMNRIMQFGGGARNSGGLSQFLDALY
ncbi:MAG TPA: capsule assembly Wzi family protein, partial [Steroidobacteraceae bacterium]|nr:capsule assembly Wzi family protein [Steroidobacteraceae bacterium]